MFVHDQYGAGLNVGRPRRVWLNRKPGQHATFKETAKAIERMERRRFIRRELGRAA